VNAEPEGRRRAATPCRVGGAGFAGGFSISSLCADEAMPAEAGRGRRRERKAREHRAQIYTPRPRDRQRARFI
jgi:hypothetical protein